MPRFRQTSDKPFEGVAANVLPPPGAGSQRIDLDRLVHVGLGADGHERLRRARRNTGWRGRRQEAGTLVETCFAGPGFGEDFGGNLTGGLQQTGSYTVTISANAGRIAYMAANAKRLYQKFTADNVTEDLRQPAVFLSIEPNQPPRDPKVIKVPAPIEQVVLKSRVKNDAVTQPTKLDKEPVEFANLAGAKFQSTRAVAVFDLAAVRELPAGDVDVVVVTPVGERECKLNAKDRARLFSAK